MIKLFSRPTEEASARLTAAHARHQRGIEARTVTAEELHAELRYADVKNSLVAETYGKCAYCESKLRHISFGDIEHIVPKSRELEKTLEYDNLTLACTVCNNRKNSYFNPELPIVDPYVDEPTEHLVAAGPFIARRPGSTRGRVTISVLALNRPDLLDRRKDRLDRLQPLMDQFVLEEAPALKAAIANELLVEAEDDKEFALAVRAFLLLCDLHLPERERPQDAA